MVTLTRVSIRVIAVVVLLVALAACTVTFRRKPIMPIDSGPLSGFDALLSTVQMPGGIPVATVAVGKAGAKNAAYLAAQMLALSDPSLAQKLVDDRAANAATVQAQNDRVQAELGS